MPKKTLTEDNRRRIAQNWLPSGMPQRAYAAANGISDRTLRQWIAHFASRPQTAPDALRAIEGLQTKLDELFRKVVQGLLDTSEESRAVVRSRASVTLRISLNVITQIAPS